MSWRGRLWVFCILPALVLFWAVIIRIAITIAGGRS